MTEAKPHRTAPWAIRGVSQESRDAATMACKRAGLPLGAWVDRVVRDAAVAELKGSARQEVGPTQADMMAQMIEGLAKVNQRLDQVSQVQQQPPQEAQNLGLVGRVRVLFTGKP